MSNLTRRMDKLELERLPNAEDIRRAEELRVAIIKARARVLRVRPDHKFSNLVPEMSLNRP